MFGIMLLLLLFLLNCTVQLLNYTLLPFVDVGNNITNTHFQRNHEQDHEDMIPKILFQSWISKDQMQDRMRNNMNAWIRQNPDYQHWFFNDKEQEMWMQINCTMYWQVWHDMLLPAA